MIKSLSLSALALATLGFNSAAQADISDFDSPRIYTGIGYGQYSFEFEDSENDTDFDDDAQMLKGYVGTQFNEYLSVELARMGCRYKTRTPCWKRIYFTRRR